MTRRRAEAALAVLFAVAILLVGGAVLSFVFTISPVHTDPAAVPSTVSAAQAERYSGALEEARRLARSLLVEENLPGLSVAVAVDGEIVWAEGFGWADVERRAPVTPLTRFRLGADSKPLTAAAIALLHDRGREADEVPGTTSFYSPRSFMRTDLGVEVAPRTDYSCFAGAGAFLSTPSDLVRFGSSMLKPGLLKAETIALLHTPLRLESGTSTEYALGWKVDSVRLGGTPVQMLGHRGSPVGGTISLMTFPDLGLVIAAASNVTHARGVAPLGLKVAEAFARSAEERVH